VSNAVRLGFSISLAFFGACLAMNVISLFGVDVMQAFGVAPQFGGFGPGVPLLLPVAAALLALAVPLLAARRIGGGIRFWSAIRSRVANTILILLLLYVAASIGYMAVHVGGGLVPTRAPVATYHQQAVLMVQFITAWGMAGFFGLAMLYRAWLDEGSAASAG